MMKEAYNLIRRLAGILCYTNARPNIENSNCYYGKETGMELKNNSPSFKFPVRMINYVIYNRLRILNKVLSLIYINTF